MDAFHVILLGLIIVLLADRQIDRAKSMIFQEKMNRALIARTVPEYTVNTKQDLKRTELENDLAVKAVQLQESEEDKRGKHYPVS